MTDKTNLKRIRLYGVGLLMLSALVSFIVATTADLSDSGLGGILNFIWPPIIGLITVILFVVVTFMVDKVGYLKGLLIILCIYNVYVGLAIRLDKAHWPLVTF